jgi:acyl dehydratase
MFDFEVGQLLPPLTSPPMSRIRFAYMAVAMRDPNLVHIEDDYARQSGLDGVIAHGTFVVSYLGATISRAVGADALRSLRVDITAPVYLTDVLTTQARVTDVSGGVTQPLVHVSLQANRSNGDVVAKGQASFVASNPS